MQNETPGFQLPGTGNGDIPQEVVKAGAPRLLDDLHIDELLHIVVDKNASDLHL